MKSSILCTAALLLLLAVPANADIIDHSMIETTPLRCASGLDMQMTGFGRDVLTAEARKKCAANCETGVAKFKDERCPKFCEVVHPIPRPPRVCVLCSTRPNDDVRRCETLVERGLQVCQRGCQNNIPVTFLGRSEVRAASNVVRHRFPSKVQ